MYNAIMWENCQLKIKFSSLLHDFILMNWLNVQFKNIDKEKQTWLFLYIYIYIKLINMIIISSDTVYIKVWHTVSKGKSFRDENW